MSLAICDNQQRESRVSSQQRCKTNISEPKRESRVYLTGRELRVSEPCVSALRSKYSSQKLKSPRQSEANLFDPPPADLRDYLTRKRSANLITPSYCCERLITTMLSECCCSSHESRQSIFRQSTPTSQLAKRYRFCRRRTFSDAEYPEITANMVSRSRGKQPLVSFDESDTEPGGVYRYTRTRTGAIAPINYSTLARGIEVNDSLQ